MVIRAIAVEIFIDIYRKFNGKLRYGIDKVDEAEMPGHQKHQIRCDKNIRFNGGLINVPDPF